MCIGPHDRIADRFTLPKVGNLVEAIEGEEHRAGRKHGHKVVACEVPAAVFPHLHEHVLLDARPRRTLGALLRLTPPTAPRAELLLARRFTLSFALLLGCPARVPAQV